MYVITTEHQQIIKFINAYLNVIINQTYIIINSIISLCK